MKATVFQSLTRICALSILLCISSVLHAASVPEGRLFRFERSTNRNYICYDVQLKNGKLDEDEPIHVYWIRAEEDGRQKELSFIQRKLAFGYKIVSRKDNEVSIHLTAYNKVVIRICRRGGKWVALTTINGKESQVTKFYAQMRSPSSLRVEYVDIFGRNAQGENVKERIMND